MDTMEIRCATPAPAPRALSPDNAARGSRTAWANDRPRQVRTPVEAPGREGGACHGGRAAPSRPGAAQPAHHAGNGHGVLYGTTGVLVRVQTTYHFGAGSGRA